MSIRIQQVRIVLDEMRKRNGAQAVAAVLKQVGAIDADSIDPSDYSEVVTLCGHPELASGTMTCKAEHETPKEIDPAAIWDRWRATGEAAMAAARGRTPPKDDADAEAGRTD